MTHFSVAMHLPVPRLQESETRSIIGEHYITTKANTKTGQHLGCKPVLFHELDYYSACKYAVCTEQRLRVHKHRANQSLWIVAVLMLPSPIFVDSHLQLCGRLQYDWHTAHTLHPGTAACTHCWHNIWI